ncbi:MAG: FKBP-type peptidyl-prolyl cis-trans isomerase [Deltaproteobacteria bacterium]|nr:FKBP-type peptidyl-prolyl cis-trans isomerase [Deltaproteobacteria bacterium]
MAMNVGKSGIQTQGAAGAPRESKAPPPGNDFLKTFRMLPKASYRETDSGLKVAVLKDGSGKSAAKGMSIKVNYTGWVIDGTRFDSSLDRGRPFEFPLGSGRVIKGWEEGIVGMEPGERRQLVIPPGMAYGKRQMGNIPPNSTLVFNIEALAVADGSPNTKGEKTVVA